MASNDYPQYDDVARGLHHAVAATLETNDALLDALDSFAQRNDLERRLDPAYMSGAGITNGVSVVGKGTAEVTLLSCVPRLTTPSSVTCLLVRLGERGARGKPMVDGYHHCFGRPYHDDRPHGVHERHHPGFPKLDEWPFKNAPAAHHHRVCLDPGRHLLRPSNEWQPGHVGTLRRYVQRHGLQADEACPDRRGETMSFCCL